MKRKKTGFIIIGLGVICIIVSLYMIHGNSTKEKQGKTAPDMITEENGEGIWQDTEGQTSDKEADEEQTVSDAEATTAIELERDKPVQEINSDMYEWPNGNSRYANRKEPDMVFYLAQNKEWFDELVGEFQQYEGRDFHGSIGWDEEEQAVYYDPLFSESVVAKYEKYKQFFQEGIISDMHVDGDGLAFYAVSNSREILYYFYDENKNEETDEFLGGNHIVHVAPHWWWQQPIDPH